MDGFGHFRHVWIADSRAWIGASGGASSRRRLQRMLGRLTSGLTAIAVVASGLTVAAIVAPASPAVAASTVQVPYVPNGAVNAVAVGADGTQSLGGDFTRVALGTGGGALLAVADASVDRTFPPVTGSIYGAVSDGTGGFFIGGSFTAVGGVARANLVQRPAK